MENKVDVNQRLSEFKKAFSDFKEKAHEFVKDMKVDVNDWKFSVENHDNEVIVDIAVKLAIKHGEKGVPSEAM